MPERKETGILSLNVKKLINLHLVWNITRKLHWGRGRVFVITRLILVRVRSEGLPKCGNTIIKSFSRVKLL